MKADTDLKKLGKLLRTCDTHAECAELLARFARKQEITPEELDAAAAEIDGDEALANELAAPIFIVVGDAGAACARAAAISIRTGTAVRSCFTAKGKPS